MGGCGLSLFNAFFYLAAHFTSAINLGIIQSIMPAMILLGSYLLFGTVVNRLQVTGLVLTFLGCIIVAAQGSIGQPSRRSSARRGRPRWKACIAARRCKGADCHPRRPSSNRDCARQRRVRCPRRARS